MAQDLIQRVKFPPREAGDNFSTTLNARVNTYFKENGISKFADARMYAKTVIIVSAYLVPLVLMLTGVITSAPAIIASWMLMGVAIAGIGMSVMHDANHGSYSSNKWVNKGVGYFLNFAGGSAENWKIQHNILHHTYTNIDGLDADTVTFPMLRFSPFAKRRAVHRLQHIYGWFFYGLMTVSWVLMKDFKQLVDYKNSGMTHNYDTGFGVLLLRIILVKAVYLLVVLALPIIILPLPWYGTLGCFFIMHFIGGLILGMVFQSAHIMEVCEFTQPDDKGLMRDSWAIHQLKTTTDFAPNNKLVTWFVGGLNFQVVHHLFPKVSHVHYPKLAPIVAQTAKEFNLPYHCIPTFTQAVLGHGRMLRALGREDVPSTMVVHT
ncbi:MAG: linoleoyl-CoA desaturase [Bacteroidia bacterium]|jgi:linoleoyl-CoA desaturase